MFRLWKRYLLLAGTAGGLAYGSQYYQLDGWQHLRLQPVTQTSPASHQTGWDQVTQGVPNTSHLQRPVDSVEDAQQLIPIWNNGTLRPASTSKPSNSSKSTSDPRIRIASFNLHAFNETKIRKGPVTETLARIIRQFDVVALQHIASSQNDILPVLVDRINLSDRRFEYLIGPRVGSDGQKQQFAFLFDTDRIETDRDQLYTVDDPQSLVDYDPLVGWFRAKQVNPDRAFTFSLVNVRFEPIHSAKQRELLPQLVRSIRQDGRVEDDVLIAGDFGCSSKDLQNVAGLSMMHALDEVATTVSGESMLDNILIPTRSTDEFTGRSGVIDFLRQLNLSFDQAMQVSSHLPVWAEFSAYEGGFAK
jgi:deoxyribonuclease-1-like protein